MKKKILKLLVCVTMSAMALTFGACGSKADSSADEKAANAKEDIADDSADSTDSAAAQEDEAAAEDAAQANDALAEAEADTLTEEENDSEDSSGLVLFDTVADFAASDLIQDQLTSMKESLAEAGMDINITGEDNKLIYTFSYLEIEKMDGMAEALEEQISAQADTFKSVAKSLKATVKVEDPVVVVTYVDANEEVIYSQEFPAE